MHTLDNDDEKVHFMTTPSRKYAIIDVETTGGSAHRERLTEIAIAIHNGNKVIDTFESLINPERTIPPFIQRLTGITDDMVEDAPYFYEIAKKVVEMTEDCIFVAHNVKFDYMFIRSEYDRLGYSYQRRQLCTKQLSKKLFPEIGRYSLDRLIDFFGIHTDVRHRAMADVLATVEVFDHLIEADREYGYFTSQINQGVKLSKLPESVTIEDIHNIPETSGIYYFFGENDHLLYVGKSKNIQKRVLQHFSNATNKSWKFLSRTFRIDYEVTGSEITAILREDEVIKKARPEYNVAQRKTQKPYGLRIVEDNTDPFFHMELHPIVDDDEAGFIKTYKSKRSGKLHVQQLLESHGLSEYLVMERKGTSLILQNGHLPIDEKATWTDQFRQLRTALNERLKFHCIVIDDSYSHHQAMGFVFQRGILIKSGDLDPQETWSDIQLDEWNECRPPRSINDQIINFIEKYRKRFTILELNDGLV